MIVKVIVHIYPFSVDSVSTKTRLKLEAPEFKFDTSETV